MTDPRTTDNPEKSKVIRLVDYLTELAKLRTKIIRDVREYPNVLWINDVPRQKDCFTQAWGRDEDSDADVWIEIQTRREPELPSVPSSCEDWIAKATLRNKSDIPDLLPEITVQLENPAWREGSDQPEFLSRHERLEDRPEIQAAWDRYVEEHWLSWVDAHNDWEGVHKVYTQLFAIHQEQLRLGEEYELVLGLGLLTWRTPKGQRVRRHLIVASALLEFEARLGKFTVRPLPDGANLRPELDMLEIEEQPARAEETAKSSLSNAADDPWDKTCIEGVLQALVHSIHAQGEYDGTLEAKADRASDQPRVECAPALILRKRSTRGLTETLKRIKARIEEGEMIPGAFKDLAETRPDRSAVSGNDPAETSGDFDGEIFFPKPSNDEQRRIVDKMRLAGGVLVQGPPGTGKSHTIANLICHLLATGQRALITAKTPRALKVLEKLVPEALRPLCINLLGSGLEEKRSLESSVGGILRKNEEWNEIQAFGERETLTQNLRALREEKAEADRRLRDIRESETHSQTLAEGAYCGTAARIAEAVNRDRDAYAWFTDRVPSEKTCPISESDLRSVLLTLRRFTAEKRQELNLVWPDHLPSIEEVSDLFGREKNAIDEEARLTKGADEEAASQLSRIDAGLIRSIHDALSAFEDERRRFSASSHAWMRDALQDITGGSASLWRALHEATEHAIPSIEPLVHVADETRLDFPDETNIKTLLEDACALKAHMENGGRLGWGPFRPKPVKACLYVLKTVRVNGRSCSNLEHFSALADALHVRVECEKAWGFWAGRCEAAQGPYALQLHTLKALCEMLSNALLLEAHIERCRETLQHCPSLSEPIWADESEVRVTIVFCKLALARRAKNLSAEEIHNIEAPLIHLAARADAHPISTELLEAVRNRDVDAFARCSRSLEDLEKERQNLQKLRENIDTLRRDVPKLTEALEGTSDDACWETRIQQIGGAWRWAQARFWIEDYIRKDDAPSLAKRSKQIEDEIHAAIAQLASLHAWSFCFSRLKENHRRHMEAWQQSMRRLGKGTGKHAPRHRREAQQHLNECREAVPAWVMPLHRVWDTVDPAPGMFDVIIVDEASQCGLEGLPLFYLGKKVLIVGDDKQISPDAVGLPRDAVHRLMEEFLHDFRFKSSFDVESSLFDHGKLRYGTRRITLREHFRCMPEIIRFSNDLCYSDTPLIPLRQYGPDRLIPLERVFVRGGFREGSNNRAVNQAEADAICEKITELCADKRYFGKTMGVVVLQGDAQAGLIEGKLLERLGAEEMECRKLLCGNPYSFQGDERDIMFLSMVAATNERIGPFTRPADERRFNVAASRARDQMYLFHSVTCDDLSISCLRRRLLVFFENTQPQEIAGIERDELERRAAQDNRTVIKRPAPFDSWFEVDVALALLRKGFNVRSQYEVAGKRIDLVVEGGRARLAVECDGDHWHGADQYEEDMQRQRQLERCGWEFVRVRESAFYANRESALRELWQALEERGIISGRLQPIVEDGESYDDDDSDGAEDVNEGRDPDTETVSNFGGSLGMKNISPEKVGERIRAVRGEQTQTEFANLLGVKKQNYISRYERGRIPSPDILIRIAEVGRVTTDWLLSGERGEPSGQATGHIEEVSISEIQDAIIRILTKCPNQSCTIHSLTARVLKQLGIVTRGKPRIEFEKRVMRSISVLEEQERLEKYKAKNRRIRLV